MLGPSVTVCGVVDSIVTGVVDASCVGEVATEVVSVRGLSVVSE